MTNAKRLTTGATLGVLALAVGGWMLLKAGAEPAVAQEDPAAQAVAQEDPAVQTAATAAQEAEQTPAEAAIAAAENADRGPAQPIPFNHAFHVTELSMSCAYCHTGTERSKVAVMPALSLCIGCHRVVGGALAPIQELRAYWARGEPVPWERVYKVPEFVQFYHEPHMRNGLECEECHGPVEEMDRIYQWSSLRMGWCLECHRGEPEETDVATDYMLSQEYQHAPTPEGRQPTGLYPYAISEEYGASRAPIDCLACHY